MKSFEFKSTGTHLYKISVYTGETLVSSLNISTNSVSLFLLKTNKFNVPSDARTIDGNEYELKFNSFLQQVMQWKGVGV